MGLTTVQRDCAACDDTAKQRRYLHANLPMTLYEYICLCLVVVFEDKSQLTGAQNEETHDVVVVHHGRLFPHFFSSRHVQLFSFVFADV